MLCGEGVWWTQDENGVTFHDSPGEPEHRPERPVLHHFRSWTLESEVKYIKSCWETCIENKVPIPIHVINLFQHDGSYQTIATEFLPDLKFNINNTSSSNNVPSHE